MVRLAFRMLSLLFLCVGTIAAAVDAIASVSASRVILTPLASIWNDVSPGSLLKLQSMLEMRFGPAAWSAVQDMLLPQPGFVVLFALSLVFWMVGYKKPSLAGRFAA
ncbi:hypothetical protein ASE36_08300 [Rhizobium sp. Root274]|uniref:hypothetical protein n=1 Tax=unclassified Rhizobium TaxID=2613769 RepID=UPI000712B46F|nr:MULTISPECIES: hypothetical protein [unclassified Rhizobium]KQW32177.1 hypothetical protein ASC71_08310 [Rhizobium sp. Root1240]KRD33717.1 hypothetical protein ASE36_08300 [Rhizobium sp. Root274]